MRASAQNLPPINLVHGSLLQKRPTIKDEEYRTKSSIISSHFVEQFNELPSKKLLKKKIRRIVCKKAETSNIGIQVAPQVQC